VKLYCAADVFVLPTLEDIWGFVINEAMACGLPVISTTASQAAYEMISPGENGYIIKPGSINQLYVALKIMCSNLTLREKMGKRSQEIAIRKFNVKLMVENFLKSIRYSLKHHSTE